MMSIPVTPRCENDDCESELSDARLDARYCSNACRQRAYRRRSAILKKYGSWEGVLESLTSHPFRVTDTDGESRNAEDKR